MQRIIKIHSSCILQCNYLPSFYFGRVKNIRLILDTCNNLAKGKIVQSQIEYKSIFINENNFMLIPSKIV